MAASSFVRAFAGRALYWSVSGTAVVVAISITSQVQAQQPRTSLEGRIVVVGVGSVHVTPDYAQVRGGVTTRDKAVKGAIEANSKVMAAIMTTLLESGVAQADIQTSRFSVQPAYAAPQPGVEQKLTGYSVSNQVEVTIRQVSRIGDVLDRLTAAGATDIGDIAFLISDRSKALDQAREAATADARRKAELYARASGVSLGRVAWITEGIGSTPRTSLEASRALSAAAPVPISSGEDTLQAQVTVAYDIMR
jgi:uncharacterized protein YggE